MADVTITFSDDLDEGFSDLISLPVTETFWSNLQPRSVDTMIVSNSGVLPSLPTRVRMFGTWVTRTTLASADRVTDNDPNDPFRGSRRWKGIWNG